MQGGYNMNIRCNQNVIFLKNHVIDFSVWLYKGYVMHTRQLWGVKFYNPALFKISILQPGIVGILTLLPAGQRKVTFQRFNRH